MWDVAVHEAFKSADTFVSRDECGLGRPAALAPTIAAAVRGLGGVAMTVVRPGCMGSSVVSARRC